MIELRGVNTELGLHNCSGSESIYLIVLESVRDESREKINMMQTALEKEEYDTYTILAHGLKSVALSIGAEQLSAMAKEHEMAGKSGDILFVKENSKILMESYEELIGQIDELLREHSKGSRA